MPVFKKRCYRKSGGRCALVTCKQHCLCCGVCGVPSFAARFGSGGVRCEFFRVLRLSCQLVASVVFDLSPLAARWPRSLGKDARGFCGAVKNARVATNGGTFKWCQASDGFEANSAGLWPSPGLLYSLKLGAGASQGLTCLLHTRAPSPHPAVLLRTNPETTAGP